MSFLSTRYSKADLASLYNPTIQRPNLVISINPDRIYMSLELNLSDNTFTWNPQLPEGESSLFEAKIMHVSLT